MAEMMECPVFPADEYVILDNGNSACSECAAKEREEKID